MEAGLAIIASLFAIIQGSVWLINGIQNHRAKKLLRELAPEGYSLTGEPKQHVDMVHEDASLPSPAVTIPHPRPTSSWPAAVVVNPSAVPTGGPPNLGSGNELAVAKTLSSATTPEAVIEHWQTQSRFRRIVRGVWHAILIAFLPVFSVASPLGLAMIVLFPFRSSIADPTIYSDESPGGSLAVAFILVIPGIIAFRHRPIGLVHRWIRRIGMGTAVLLGVLFFCLIAFVEPS